MPARPRGDVHRARPYLLCLEALEARQLLSGVSEAALLFSAVPQPLMFYVPAVAAPHVVVTSPSQSTNTTLLNSLGTEPSQDGTDSSQADSGANGTAAAQAANPSSAQTGTGAGNSSQTSTGGTASKPTTGPTQKDGQPQTVATATAGKSSSSTSAGSTDSQSQSSDDDPQPDIHSPLLSLLTPNTRVYGFDAATQPLNLFALASLPAETVPAQPTPNHTHATGDAGVNQLLGNGSAWSSLQGGTSLQAFNAGGEVVGNYWEALTQRVGSTSRDSASVALHPNQPMEETFASSRGWAGGVIDFATGLPADLLPQMGAVAAGIMSVDMTAIQRGVDQFFTNLDGLADDLSTDFTALQVALWLATACGTVAGLDLVRRRPRLPLAVPGSYSWTYQGSQG